MPPFPHYKKRLPFAARDNQKVTQYPAVSPQPVEIPTLLPQHPQQLWHSTLPRILQGEFLHSEMLSWNYE